MTNLASGTKKQKKKDGPDALRNDAEKRITKKLAESTTEEGSAPDQLIHELRVHQIELEMQNEELRKAHLALEESRDKYVDLYEFAPVGYLTLTKKALIEEGNLTAAALLGVDRRNLIKDRFRKYLVAEDLEYWDQFFISVLRSTEKLTCDIRLLKGNGSRFHARVESLRIEREKKDPVVRVAISDISATTSMQEQIAANEERLKALLHNASDIIRILNREGRIVFDSTASERVLGYPPGFTIGKSPFEFIHPDDIPIVKREIARVFEKTNTGVPTEFRIRKADGSYVGVESVGKNMFGVPGIDGIVMTTRVIDERKKAEQALRESEARYSSLFDNNYSISLLIDPDNGMIVDANDAAARYYGYTREQLTSRGIYDLNRLNKKTVVKNLIRAKDEQAKHFFSTHYLGNGEKRRVEVYSGPITVNGKPLFYSIIHDVTERRKAEEELQKSHQILEGILNTIPVSVFWKDKDLTYLGCNTPFAHDAGFEKPEDIIGKDDYTMGWHEQAEIYRADDRLVIDSGRIKFLIEEPQTTPSGDRIHLLTSKVPLKDTHGEIIGVLGSYLDITDRKMMEEEVRSLNKVLEQRVFERTEQLNASLEEKVLLLREIHHRVKNNLQIVASLLNLQSRYITDKKVLETLRDSQSRVRAMALVHERVYQSPEIGTINLGEYIRYLVNQIFRFYNIPQSQIEVSVTIDDVSADIDTAIPVGLIINELISNALKHAFPEGRKGKITVKGTQFAPDQLQFVFRDDGIGMPADYDWNDSHSLGLRLVKSLTKQLMGSVEMVQDGGTVYTIRVKPKNPFKRKEEHIQS